MRQQNGKNISLVRGIARSLPLLFAAFLTIGSGAGATIQYDVSQIGSTGGGFPVYRYTYIVNGIFAADQEIDIRFDAALYGDLRNGFAGSDFDLMLFQPNNPPGSA